MAGEVIDVKSTFVQVQASALVAAGDLSAGGRTTIAAALGVASDYPSLDFRLDVTSGTIATNTHCELYFRPNDGTNESPAPDASHLEQYRGKFKLRTGTTGSYFLYGVPNDDKNGTYYWRNMDPANAMTASLSARGTSSNTAA